MLYKSMVVVLPCIYHLIEWSNISINTIVSFEHHPSFCEQKNVGLAFVSHESVWLNIQHCSSFLEEAGK